MEPTNAVILSQSAEELKTTIYKEGLDVKIVEHINTQFVPFIEDLDEWKEKSKAVVVTDVSQTDLMAEAKKVRNIIVKKRTAADRVRQELKQDSLKYGRAVQNAYNFIEAEFKAIEAHLKEQEEYAERIEQERIAKIVDVRLAAMSGLEDYFPFKGTELAYIEDGHFANLVEVAKKAKAEKEEKERLENLDAQARLEENRKWMEQQLAEQRERDRLEKERILREHQEALDKAEKEKQEFIAKMKAEVAPAPQASLDEPSGATALYILGKKLREDNDLLVETAKMYFDEYDSLLDTDKEVVHKRIFEVMGACYRVAKKHNL